ncbi:hypothetical protein [Micromonospora purpureochromogenes]|uniref:Uncharacterized protein n=1 Tax=Micromonospora purpureochromogenes TaxID=47872 RepID=A0ABX2RJA2_9ACTN|nr:hypothetical protein [Micromonospora purpureochromogenes]NYF56371.1 hypothetical protein [Micromonospora purpureochromogenes]
MTSHDEGRADEEPPGSDVPAPEPGAEPEAGAAPGVARRGPAWLIVGVVAATLLICCCSAVVGLVLSWSAGLLGSR